MKNDEELDFNKKNLLETKNIMDKATSIESDEWDRNNPIIKIILGILFVFILYESKICISVRWGEAIKSCDEPITTLSE